MAALIALKSCKACKEKLPSSQASSSTTWPPSTGGVGQVHVPTQVQALQAKAVSRLLEPESLPWKVFPAAPARRGTMHSASNIWAGHLVQHPQHQFSLQLPASVMLGCLCLQGFAAITACSCLKT